MIPKHWLLEKITLTPFHMTPRHWLLEKIVLTQFHMIPRHWMLEKIALINCFTQNGFSKLCPCTLRLNW